MKRKTYSPITKKVADKFSCMVAQLRAKIQQQKLKI